MEKLLLAIIPMSVVLIVGCELLGQNGIYTLKTGISEEEAGSISPPTRDYEEGTEITLEANPIEDHGWRFLRWEGDLSGTENPVTIEIKRDMEVTAVFWPMEYFFDIQTEGQGSVNVEITDGGAGVIDGEYQHGSMLELYPQPAPGWKFCKWQGDFNNCENPLERGIWENRSVTAFFYPVEIFNTTCDESCLK